MTPPVLMHINYCEQGQSIAEACRIAARCGFDGIEFRRKRVGVAESVEEYLDAIADGLAGANLATIVFGGPGPNLMAPDKDVRKAELNEAIAFYTLAATRFHLSVCNTDAGALRNPDPGIPRTPFDRHGSSIASPSHWQWAVEGYRALGDLAQRLGFRLAFETHPGYLHDTLEATLKLVKAVDHPAVGVNLDPTNLAAFANPPSVADAVGAAGEKLFYVHFKNYRRLNSGERLLCSLSDGELNHREFLRLLSHGGYAAPICVECPRRGDREQFASEDVQYMRSLLADQECLRVPQ